VSITTNQNGSFKFNAKEPLVLTSSEALPRWQLCFETFGKLSVAKDNVIVIHHALSVGSHVTSSTENTAKGWWQDMVGSGKAIDTDRFYVICINNLGSCFGSSSPVTVNPVSNQLWGGDFPAITIEDMVNSQKTLLEYLGIQRLYAIIGNSMGAMLSLTWAIAYPDMITRLMLTCTSYKAYPANIANRHIQQQAIRLDPAFKDGYYELGTQLSGFKLARKLGLYTYRNSTEWNRRFNSFDQQGMCDDEINRYMEYNADTFCRQFDANSYLLLTTAMDQYNVTQSYSSNASTFSRISAKTTVISVESDILFTPQQQQELYQGLQQGSVDCQYINHQSHYGHDAFLVETEAFSNYIQFFLS
jgi:homoserine O-acetyltransferase